MKMKKGLLSVVFLLATSSAMAAMSFTSASVTSDMTGSVKSTNASLLAIKDSTHAASDIVDGVLKIDLNKGKDNNKSFGLQKNSVYTWDDLFKIHNFSENVAIDVKIKTAQPLPKGVKLYVKTLNLDWKEITGDGAYFTSKEWEQGYERGMDIKVEVDNTASIGDFAPNLVVEAVDVSGVKR